MFKDLLIVAVVAVALAGCGREGETLHQGAPPDSDPQAVSDPFPPLAEEPEVRKRLLVDELLLSIKDRDEASIREAAQRVTRGGAQLHALYQLRKVLDRRPEKYPEVDIPRLRPPKGAKEVIAFDRELRQREKQERERRKVLGITDEIERIQSSNAVLQRTKAKALVALGELGPEAVPTLVRIAKREEFAISAGTEPPPLLGIDGKSPQTEFIADQLTQSLETGALARDAEMMLCSIETTAAPGHRQQKTKSTTFGIAGIFHLLNGNDVAEAAKARVACDYVIRRASANVASIWKHAMGAETEEIGRIIR